MTEDIQNTLDLISFCLGELALIAEDSGLHELAERIRVLDEQDDGALSSMLN